MIIDASPSFRKRFEHGERVSGHVLRELPDNQVILRLKGSNVIVSSSLNIRTGMQLTMRVTRISDTLELSIEKTIHKQDLQPPFSITI